MKLQTSVYPSHKPIKFAVPSAEVPDHLLHQVKNKTEFHPKSVNIKILIDFDESRLKRLSNSS